MDKLGVIFEAGRFETLFGAATSGSSSSVLKGDTAAGLEGPRLVVHEKTFSKLHPKPPAPRIHLLLLPVRRVLPL